MKYTELYGKYIVGDEVWACGAYFDEYTGVARYTKPVRGFLTIVTSRMTFDRDVHTAYCKDDNRDMEAIGGFVPYNNHNEPLWEKASPLCHYEYGENLEECTEVFIDLVKRVSFKILDFLCGVSSC